MYNFYDIGAVCILSCFSMTVSSFGNCMYLHFLYYFITSIVAKWARYLYSCFYLLDYKCSVLLLAALYLLISGSLKYNLWVSFSIKAVILTYWGAFLLFIIMEVTHIMITIVVSYLFLNVSIWQKLSMPLRHIPTGFPRVLMALLYAFLSA
jgi:hypothetical protein